jgi:hypothetical protein
VSDTISVCRVGFSKALTLEAGSDVLNLTFPAEMTGPSTTIREYFNHYDYIV